MYKLNIKIPKIKGINLFNRFEEVDDLYFKKSLTDWTLTRTDDYGEFEYKIVRYFTKNKEVIADLAINNVIYKIELGENGIYFIDVLWKY